MNSYQKKYSENRDKRIIELVDKLEKKQININELEDNLINELMYYYTKEICLKKKQINDIRDKIKKGEI